MEKLPLCQGRQILSKLQTQLPHVCCQQWLESQNSVIFFKQNCCERITTSHCRNIFNWSLRLTMIFSYKASQAATQKEEETWRSGALNFHWWRNEEDRIKVNACSVHWVVTSEQIFLAYMQGQNPDRMPNFSCQKWIKESGKWLSSSQWEVHQCSMLNKISFLVKVDASGRQLEQSCFNIMSLRQTCTLHILFEKAELLQLQNSQKLLKQHWRNTDTGLREQNTYY